MTIICALNDESGDKVWVGCNDRATIGDSPAPASASKWLHFGGWLVGLSGDESVYEQFLLINEDKFPATSDKVLDVFQFMRSVYDDLSLGQQKGGDTTPSYGVDGILVHQSGRMWDFDSRLALSEVPSGRLWACGSGVDYALGADHALQGEGLSAKERVARAVEAAIALDIGCPGEILLQVFDRTGALSAPQA